MPDAPRPTAWMLRAQRAVHTRSARQYGEVRVICGQVFMSETTAIAAAARLTNRWRRVECFAVYDREPIDLVQRCTAIADQAVPQYRTPKPGGGYYTCTGIYAKRWKAAWDGACIALGGNPQDHVG